MATSQLNSSTARYAHGRASSSMTLLDQIASDRRQAVAHSEANRPVEVLRDLLAARERQRPFKEALTRPGVSIIAEFKRRSPTRGPIAPGAEVGPVVEQYERAGAAALSIIVESDHFDGSLDDLAEARRATKLPVLYKDFVVSRYQLLEAAVSGADAVLLMVGLLDRNELAEFYVEAQELDLDCLVEVHTEDELAVAIDLDVDVVGINNRMSFGLPGATELTDLDQTRHLLADVPTGKTVVSESGISSRDEVAELEAIGVDAFLVGSMLMLASDKEATLRALIADEVPSPRT